MHLNPGTLDRKIWLFSYEEIVTLFKTLNVTFLLVCQFVSSARLQTAFANQHADFNLILIHYFLIKSDLT